MRFTDVHVENTAKRLLYESRRRLEQVESRRARLQGLLKEVARTLLEQFSVDRVLIIGSLDAPWFSEESDVDIVVSGLDPGLVHAAERRVMSILSARVDLLRLEELDPLFREMIEREGRLIQ